MVRGPQRPHPPPPLSTAPFLGAIRTSASFSFAVSPAAHPRPKAPGDTRLGIRTAPLQRGRVLLFLVGHSAAARLGSPAAAKFTVSTVLKPSAFPTALLTPGQAPERHRALGLNTASSNVRSKSFVSELERPRMTKALGFSQTSTAGQQQTWDQKPSPPAPGHVCFLQGQILGRPCARSSPRDTGQAQGFVRRDQC